MNNINNTTPSTSERANTSNTSGKRTRKTYYYLHDHNKNVVGLIDKQGNRVATYEYGPYGEITHQSGPMAEENPIRYSSEFYNSDTGLVEYLYRLYNPKDGRWLQRDPIAERGGNNLYGFVENNPINLIDQLGLVDFENDMKNCTRTMVVKVKLIFKDRRRKPRSVFKEASPNPWDKNNDKRKNDFKEKLKNSIEDKFNNNDYKTKPDKKGNCYKPKVRIEYVDSGSADWDLNIYSGPAGRYRASSEVGFSADGKLYEDSVDNTVSAIVNGVEKRDGQIPALHEFGHAIGLDHPGKGVEDPNTKKTYKTGSHGEYYHKGKDRNGNEVDGKIDLMGGGTGLRPFYFDKWN